MEPSFSLKAPTMKFALLFALLFFAPAAHAQMAIIANRQVPRDSINGLQLRDIYTLNERQWGNGTRIVPIILKGSGSCMTTFYSVVGRKPLEMRKLWMLAKLTGETNAPVALESDEDVVAMVSRTPGAIGIIHADSPAANTKLLLMVVE